MNKSQLKIVIVLFTLAFLGACIPVKQEKQIDVVTSIILNDKAKVLLPNFEEPLVEMSTASYSKENDGAYVFGFTGRSWYDIADEYNGKFILPKLFKLSARSSFETKIEDCYYYSNGERSFTDPRCWDKVESLHHTVTLTPRYCEIESLEQFSCDIDTGYLSGTMSIEGKMLNFTLRGKNVDEDERKMLEEVLVFLGYDTDVLPEAIFPGANYEITLP